MTTWASLRLEKCICSRAASRGNPIICRAMAVIFCVLPRTYGDCIHSRVGGGRRSAAILDSRSRSQGVWACGGGRTGEAEDDDRGDCVDEASAGVSSARRFRSFWSRLSVREMPFLSRPHIPAMPPHPDEAHLCDTCSATGFQADGLDLPRTASIPIALPKRPLGGGADGQGPGPMRKFNIC